jgi:hypothetical protein
MEDDTAMMAANARMLDTEVDNAPDTTTSNAQREISTLDAVKHPLSRLHPHAKLARQYTFTLLVGLAIFSTIFALLSAGFNQSSKNVESRLQVARVEDLGLFVTNSRDGVLYGQLDKILDTQLSNVTESYEDCLVRGLQVADQQLFGRAYHRWDTVHKTFDWTLMNCGRLHHAPQLSQATVHQATNCRGSPEHTTRFLPLGFLLKCDKFSSCYLMYTPSVHEPSHKTRVTDECLAKSMAKVCDLQKAYDLRRSMQCATARIATCHFGLGIISLYTYMIFAIWTCDELRHWLINEAPGLLFFAGMQLAAAPKQESPGDKDFLLWMVTMVPVLLSAITGCTSLPHRVGDPIDMGHIPHRVGNPIEGLCRVARDALADFRDPEKYPYVLVEGKVVTRPTSPTSPAQAPSPLASAPVAPTSPPVDPARPLSPLAGLLAALIISLGAIVEYHSLTVHYEPNGTEAESQMEIGAEPENDPQSDPEAEAAIEREVERETKPDTNTDDSEWAFVDA